jgi:hypothetical protein
MTIFYYISIDFIILLYIYKFYNFIILKNKNLNKIDKIEKIYKQNRTNIIMLF